MGLTSDGFTVDGEVSNITASPFGAVIMASGVGKSPFTLGNELLIENERVLLVI